MKRFLWLCMYGCLALLFFSNTAYSRVSDEYDPPSQLQEGMQVLGTWRFKLVSGTLPDRPHYYWIDGKQTVDGVSCWRMFDSDEGFFVPDNYGINYVAIVDGEYRYYMQEGFFGDQYSKKTYSPYCIAWKYGMDLGEQWSQEYTYTDTAGHQVSTGTVSETHRLLDYEEVTTDFGTYPDALKVEIHRTEKVESNVMEALEEILKEYGMESYLDSMDVDAILDMIGGIEGMESYWNMDGGVNSYTNTTTETTWNALGIGMVLMVYGEEEESAHVTYEFISDPGASGPGLSRSRVSQLYVSIFGRASEGDGNTYWQTTQEDLTAAADTMLATGAARDYFGATLDDDQAFIEFIYENTLGKTYAQDPDGVDYWVGELASGKSKGQVVSSLVNAVMDPQYTGDPAQNRFINRVTVCNYAADNIPSADVDDLTPFVGFIEYVTDDPGTVDAAKALIDGF